MIELIPLILPCDMCNGTGQYSKDIPCEFCEGKGKVTNPESYWFRKQNK